MPEPFSTSVPTRRDALAASPGAGNPDKLGTVVEKSLAQGVERHGAASGVRTNPQGRQAFRVCPALLSDPMAPPHCTSSFVRHDTGLPATEDEVICQYCAGRLSIVEEGNYDQTFNSPPPAGWSWSQPRLPVPAIPAFVRSFFSCLLAADRHSGRCDASGAHALRRRGASRLRSACAGSDGGNAERA